MQVKQKIQELLKQLNKGVYEKEEVMALTLLSAIAGESIFFLGPPGVAKSLIARRLKYAFEDGKAFEYLMSRFSTPDEIFGPVKISKLKEDIYERDVNGYLPSATVVFLDEIWKAGPSIQNSLLTVLNEKIYRNGAQEIKDLPMKALISASNELPAKDENLEALWDRFLVRLVVGGIQQQENFEDMISEKLDFDENTITDDLKITDEEYQGWAKEIDGIEPESVFNVISVIREKLQLHNDKKENEDNQIYISDRRWRKIVRILRTSAFLNERKAVDLMDCFLIKECIWNKREQEETVRQFVTDTIRDYGYKLEFDFKSLKEALDEFKEEIKDETKVEKNARKEELVTNDKYYELENPLSSYAQYIPIEIFNQLTTENRHNYLYYFQYNSFYQHSNYDIKKGKDKFHISINDKEYKLKTVIRGDKRIITKKPHEAVIKDWDEKIEKLLEYINEQKDGLEKYRTKDLEHLRTNIFVNPNLATIVETSLTETKNQIDKYEVEIRQIQNDYKNLEDKEVAIQ
jgi:MoxR-like ATPase